MSPERLVAIALNGEPLTSLEAEQLRAGLGVWMRAGAAIALPRCLGLPNTPAKARQAARDGYLLRAARLFDGSLWQRAAALHGSIETFRRHRWLCWLHLSAPPEHASALDALLWHAAQAAPDDLPGTPQALHQLLKKHLQPSA